MSNLPSFPMIVGRSKLHNLSMSMKRSRLLLHAELAHKGNSAWPLVMWSGGVRPGPLAPVPPKLAVRGQESPTRRMDVAQVPALARSTGPAPRPTAPRPTTASPQSGTSGTDPTRTAPSASQGCSEKRRKLKPASTVFSLKEASQNVTFSILPVLAIFFLDCSSLFTVYSSRSSPSLLRQTHRKMRGSRAE